MKDYLKEFEETLDRIVRPVLNDDDFDDMDLATHGAELDQEPKLGKGYDQDPMTDQLEKVVQSANSPKPVTTITTDDGKEHKITADQARTLRMLMTTDKVKSTVRAQFQKDIQHSNGLQDFLDMDYHEMPSLFVKRYLG